MAAGAAAAGSRGGAAPARRRPNILLLMTDQHRADCVGAYGNAAIRTPHLDRIAAEGARFSCAYTSTPSCTPARAGLLTGLSPWRHGMLGYGQVALRYRNEMPRLLRAAGYQTLGIGKMHWHPQRNLHGFHRTILDESGRIESPGFESDYRAWFREQAPGQNPDATGIGWNDYAAREYALPERLHPTRWTGDRAVEFLEGYRDAAPFFLKVSFARPHSPYDAPARFFRMYADAALPPAVKGDWCERYAMRDRKLPSDTWWGDLGAEQVRRSRQGYYGSVTFIDEQVGRILDVLGKRGMLENTLILFTADHGDMTGDHNLWRKTYPYEASARIPMLIRWPEGFDAGRRGQELRQTAELRDVLPTFLDAAGVRMDPAEFDGRSLLDPIRGKAGDWRPYLDLEHARCYFPENDWNALTDGRHKYVYWAVTGEEQLFDLEKDPHELRNLAGLPEYCDTLRLWHGRMVEHLGVRGERYVANGELVERKKTILYSPNYPR